MATTTTNFGWDIPQSTDLVKDGATAIAALGQDIDTALIDLKGGTTGQVLAKASATDLDFSWVAQDDSNAIQNAIVDAKGDLISATAADTPARLAVGANNTVLTADSSTATGLKWAAPASGGGITLLSTTSLSGTSTTVSSINQTYVNLLIVIEGVSSSASFAPALQYNSVTSGYKGQLQLGGTGSIVSGSTGGADVAVNQTFSATDLNSYIEYSITNYATTGYHAVRTLSNYFISGASDFYTIAGFSGNGNTSAVTSVTFVANGGSFDAGTIKIYGVK